MGEDHDLDPVTDEQAAWEIEMDRLWTRNLIAFCIHAFNSVAGLLLNSSVENYQNFKIPLSTQFLEWECADCTPEVDLKTVWEFPFVYYTCFFGVMSALAHLFVLRNWDSYEEQLKKGMNRYRWYEYSMSSSLMMMLICMLFGTYDMISLIQIGAINACMCFFGDNFEVLNAGRKPDEIIWAPFFYGCIAGVYPWVVIFINLFYSPNGTNEIPGFVWGILFSYMFMFGTFPWTMWRQYTQSGKYDNSLYPLLQNGGYLKGERTYITLSWVAKSLLLWLVLNGSNQPSSYTETAITN